MPESPSPRRSRMQGILMAVVIVLLSLAFTWLCVSYSKRFWRLAFLPTFDDVDYFATAAEFLAFYKEHGKLDTIGRFATSYLHSPFSVVTAFLSFAIAGVRFDAPYYANALVCMIYLASVAYFTRRLSTPVRLGSLVFALGIPFITLGIVEFRPDILWATLLGTAAIFCLTRERFFLGAGPTLAGGLLFALPMMVKPSTFLMTILVAGFCCFWAIVRRLVSREESIGGILWHCLRFSAAFILPISPYYLLNFSSVWRYFYENSFGANRAVWTHPGDIWEHLGFYWINPVVPLSNLGHFQYLFLAIILSWTIWTFLRKDRPAGERWVTAGILILICCTYLASGLYSMKSPFLGGSFYGTFIFASLYCGARWLEQMPRFRTLGLPSWLLALVLGLAGWSLYAWPPSAKPDVMRWRNETILSNRTAVAVSNLNLPEKPIIMYTQSGPVVEPFVRMYVVGHGKKPVQTMASYADSLEDFIRLAGTSDVVVAQDEGMFGTPGNLMPGEAWQDEFRDWLFASDEFQYVTQFKGFDGNNIYIFQRRTPRNAQPPSGS